MGVSAILGITEVESSQDQKEVTINDGFSDLEKSLTQKLPISLASSNSSLTLEQLRRNNYFFINGISTSGRELSIPNTIERDFIVESDTSNTHSFILTNTESYSILPGEIAHVRSGDGFLRRISSNKYYMHGFVKSVAANSTILAWSTPGNQSVVILPQGLVDSQIRSLVAPSGSVTFDIRKNGVSVGSVNFNSSTTGVITFLNTQTLGSSDFINIVSPNSLLGIQDIIFTLSALKRK